MVSKVDGMRIIASTISARGESDNEASVATKSPRDINMMEIAQQEVETTTERKPGMFTSASTSFFRPELAHVFGMNDGSRL
ncbi:hypothetical protein ACRAJ3_01720 [Rhodococcus pyridinivorans]|uniref:hypothetical protein n=1 Tax=Rhodococcus pyridinivorans TaxID=103816 RepID=UPI003D7FD721